MAGLGQEDAGVRAGRNPAVDPPEAHIQVAPAGRRAQAFELALHDDAPVIDDDDVLADVLDEVELMAGEHDRRAVAREVADDRGQGVDAERVEPGERLVEDEGDRVVDERRRELHALLVAVRQRVHPVLAALLETEPREPPPGAGLGVAAIEARKCGEVLELCPHLHVRVEPALLWHVAEAQAGPAVDRRTGPAHLAAVRPDEVEDAAHRRGLACAVGTQEPQDPSRADRDAALVERQEVAVALGQADELEP